MWPIDKCMQTLQAQSVKTIQYRSQWYKNSACNVFYRKYLHIYYPPYLKKNFQFLVVHKSRKIANIKMYKTQKLINQFLNQVECPI